ncbi:MAG: helix-turn-helix domain-containing protein [Pirellulales bacterium]
MDDELDNLTHENDAHSSIVPRWLSIDRAADYSSLSVASIRRLLAGGKLVARRPVRGRVVIDRLELDSFVAGSVASIRVGRGKHRMTSPKVGQPNSND